MFNLKDYNLNDKAVELFNTLTNNGLDIDTDKLASWLKEKGVAFKQSPTGWFLKVFPNEYKNGTFNNIEYIPASQPLFNAMRERGIVVKQNDCLYIDLLLTKICAKLPKDEAQEQIRNWLMDAINFLIDKVEKPTSSHLISVFKRSKAIKELNIDWKALEKEYEEELANCEAMMLAIQMEGK